MLFCCVNEEKNRFMKLKIASAFIFLLFAFSCKKDANNSLIGKWRTTQIYYAADGQGMYMTKYGINTAGGQLYVQFGLAGTIQSTFFADSRSYSVKGNQITINLTGAADVTQATYAYTIKNDTLKMYPNEGCSGCVFPFVRE